MLKLVFCFALTAFAAEAKCLDCEGLYWYDEFDDSGDYFRIYDSEKCFEGKLHTCHNCVEKELKDSQIIQISLIF